MPVIVNIRKCSLPPETAREIPQRCPKCKTNLREQASIVERGYAPTVRYFSVDPNADDELSADSDAIVDEDGETVATSYACAKCSTRLDGTPKKKARR